MTKSCLSFTPLPCPSHTPLMPPSTQITYRNRLAIEVLEAQELRPIVSGKTENVFCKIYMKCESNSNMPSFSKVRERKGEMKG